MAASRNHKAMWQPARETQDQRRVRLAQRRRRQMSLQPGVIKANLLDKAAYDARTGKLTKRLLTSPRVRVSKYRPHQGRREIARRLRQAATIAEKRERALRGGGAR